MSNQVGYASAESSLGDITTAWIDNKLVAVSLTDDKDAGLQEIRSRFATSILVPDDSTRAKTLLAALVKFVDDPTEQISAPSNSAGTSFQQAVWTAIQAVPLGETTTYSDVAKAIGQPQSSRAVAQACGANPLALVIPCHRVTSHNGALSGYKWGEWRKKALLAKEKRIKERSFFATPNDRPSSSIFAQSKGDVHIVPMSVIRRPLPSELDESKVEAFMREMKSGDVFTPIELVKVKARLKVDPEGPLHTFYFSMGGCHRYEATKRLALPSIRARIIEAPPSQLRVYLGSGSPF